MFEKNFTNEKKNADKLQKFTKNKKQKQMIIGAIIAIVLVIGGITLYRSFAIYEEKMSFNVLNGVIPNFQPICDPNLNGAEPVISGNLIPVVIDENSVVTKVDSKNSDWYDYCGKKWANAVITQNSYKSLEASGNVKGTNNTGRVDLTCTDCYINLGQGNHNFDKVSLAIRVQVKDLTKTDTQYALISNKTNTSGMSIYLESSTHKIAFSFYNESTGKFEELVSDVVPETTKYYTIVGTYDGHVMNLYVNGTLFTKEIEGKIKTSDKSFFIGKNPEETKGHPYLNVKQAGIFDRVISDEEIEKGFTEDIKLFDGTSITKFVDFTERKQEAGEVIPEGIIESYFVWIPKFKYRLFDMGDSYNELSQINDNKIQAIHIKFGTVNTSDKTGECKTPGVLEDNGNCKVGDWMTHPAFTSFGDVTGLWVGKFETGYNGANNKSTFSSSSTEANILNTNKIIIKPGSYTWREINIANAYQNAFDYKRDLESHMMKNTEWGAVAYLTNSIYGRCTRNADATASCEEVTINNYQDKYGNFKTGYAAVNEPTTGSGNESISCSESKEACNEFGTDANTTISYRNIESAKASTTGTYSGIYDLNGGGLEYVMAGLEDGNHKLSYGSDGFTTVTLPNDSKYYDLYKTGTSGNDYSRRILGDATGELGPFEAKVYDHLTTNISSWYDDAASFITKADENKTWFNRGGQAIDGTSAGIFYFRPWNGEQSGSRTFRIVLAPNKQ